MFWYIFSQEVKDIFSEAAFRAEAFEFESEIVVTKIFEYKKKLRCQICIDGYRKVENAAEKW